MRAFFGFVLFVGFLFFQFFSRVGLRLGLTLGEVSLLRNSRRGYKAPNQSDPKKNFCAREVGHTISDSSQYLPCIMCINLFSASIRLSTSG